MYDAAAEGDFIDPGEQVTIVDTSGNRIIVRKA
jgi:membrane-bound ClpP family serine protease